MMIKTPEPKQYLICRELSGVLQQDGKPVANAKISRKLTWNGNEAGVVDYFETDHSGRFNIPAEYKTLSINPLTQFVAKSNLTITYENKESDLWYEAIMSESPKPIGDIKNLVCEYGAELERVKSDAGLLGTTCKWNDMPKEEDPYAL
ncbi:MAG TPA: DUF6795 domain-containing protein [Marinagarivorans sp.]